MTLGETIAQIKTRLQKIYSDREIEAIVRIIFEYLLGYSRVDIIMHKDSEIPDFIVAKTDKIVERLSRKEPIQYITGEARFYGNNFKVTRDTLIPRPETEELVDMIVRENEGCDLRVLDIGTGSGCIAISLARAMKFPKVTAVDIREKALEVARQNATQLKVKVNFIKGDIFAMNPEGNSYDIIVSNPPYIAENERSSMEENVLLYEPAGALFVADDTPIIFYTAIAQYAREALSPGGRLYFEINPLYAGDVVNMLDVEGFDRINVCKDMQKRNRFVAAQKPKA